jgi:general secretion pathway protein G
MTMTLHMKRPGRGFSLIELLAAAAILGLLASVAVPFVETAIKREKEQALRIALRDIRQAIDAYKQATAAGQITVAKDASGYPPTLTDLVAGSEDAAKPGRKLYFLRRIPRDPFYPDATTGAVDTWGLRSFDSPADHPKKGDDVFDVYSTSGKTGLNGVPYGEW